MAKRTIRSTASADTAWEVQITVTAAGRTRGRASRRVVAAVGVAIILALLAVVSIERSGAVRPRPTLARRDTAALTGVAAAFGYPSRCLNVTVSAGAPAYAQAQVVRRRGCPLYRGYLNATFHRVEGIWRLVLDEGQLFVPNRLLARCRSAWPNCRAR